MAFSKCVSCGSAYFEVVEARNLKGSNFKLMFVQCSSCGGVVGVTEYFNVGALLQKIMLKLGVR